MSVVVNREKQLLTLDVMEKFALSTLGARIRKARQWANLSQDEMAELTDVSAVQVSRWENDKSSPTIPRLAQIAQATGQPLYWFFLGPTGIIMDYPDQYRARLLGIYRDLDEQTYEDFQRDKKENTSSPMPVWIEEEIESPPPEDQELAAEAWMAHNEERMQILAKRVADLEDSEAEPPPGFRDAIEGYLEPWRKILEERLGRVESEVGSLVTNISSSKPAATHDPTPPASAPDGPGQEELPFDEEPRRVPEPASNHRPFGDIAADRKKKKKRRGTSSA